MMKGQAFVEFDSRNVALACVAWKNLRETRIEARKEALIEEAMKPTKHWFGLKTRQRTREQAIEACSYDFDIIENIGSYWAEKIQCLLDLAEKSETVFVDAELFSCIESFYHRKVD